MKKYLFILAGLLCVIGQSEAEAKAVKLGRGGMSLSGGINTPDTDKEKECKKSCTLECYKDGFCTWEKYCRKHPTDTDICSNPNRGCGVHCLAAYCNKTNGKCTKCEEGYFPNTDGKCVKCSTIKITDASTGAEVGTVLKCDQEIGKVIKATCTSNRYPDYSLAEARSLSQHVCKKWTDLTCATGYRVKTQSDNSACCVPLCEGVSCVSGYTATPETGRCVCKPTNAGNCAEFADGSAVCAKCQSGYYLDGNSKCRQCPANATCNGTSSWSCNANYYHKIFPINGAVIHACLACPANSTCPQGDASGEQSFTCNAGYIDYLFEPDVGGAYWGCKACSEEIEGCSACNYNSNGAIQCTACGTGYYNAAMTIVPKCYKKNVCTLKNGMQVCVMQQVCPAVSTVAMCEPCPAGCATCHKQGASLICDSCAADQYMGSDGNCKTCPTGATCNGVTFTCASNMYKTGTGCSACPTGATCDGSETVTCPSGKYLRTQTFCGNGWCNTQQFCEACPSGCSACSLNNGSVICSACSSNSLLQNNTCVACPSGATCDGTSSFTCAPNTYPRSWGCAACPDHATCNGSDAPTCACGYERQYFPINGTGFYACIESSNVSVACATQQQQAAAFDDDVAVIK